MVWACPRAAPRLATPDQGAVEGNHRFRAKLRGPTPCSGAGASADPETQGALWLHPPPAGSVPRGLSSAMAATGSPLVRRCRPAGVGSRCCRQRSPGERCTRRSSWARWGPCSRPAPGASPSAAAAGRSGWCPPAGTGGSVGCAHAPKALGRTGATGRQSPPCPAYRGQRGRGLAQLRGPLLGAQLCCALRTRRRLGRGWGRRPPARPPRRDRPGTPPPTPPFPGPPGYGGAAWPASSSRRPPPRAAGTWAPPAPRPPSRPSPPRRKEPRPAGRSPAPVGSRKRKRPRRGRWGRPDRRCGGRHIMGRGGGTFERLLGTGRGLPLGAGDGAGTRLAGPGDAPLGRAEVRSARPREPGRARGRQEPERRVRGYRAPRGARRGRSGAFRGKSGFFSSSARVRGIAGARGNFPANTPAVVERNQDKQKCLKQPDGFIPCR